MSPLLYIKDTYSILKLQYGLSAFASFSDSDYAGNVALPSQPLNLCSLWAVVQFPGHPNCSAMLLTQPLNQVLCGRRTHSDISPGFLGLSSSSHPHHRIVRHATPSSRTTSATISGWEVWIWGRHHPSTGTYCSNVPTDMPPYAPAAESEPPPSTSE